MIARNRLSSKKPHLCLDRLGGWVCHGFVLADSFFVRNYVYAETTGRSAKEAYDRYFEAYAHRMPK
jgi:hypothetical protein